MQRQVIICSHEGVSQQQITNHMSTKKKKKVKLPRFHIREALRDESKTPKAKSSRPL